MFLGRTIRLSHCCFQLEPAFTENHTTVLENQGKEQGPGTPAPRGPRGACGAQQGETGALQGAEGDTVQLDGKVTHHLQCHTKPFYPLQPVHCLVMSCQAPATCPFLRIPGVSVGSSAHPVGACVSQRTRPIAGALPQLNCALSRRSPNSGACKGEGWVGLGVKSYPGHMAQ